MLLPSHQNLSAVMFNGQVRHQGVKLAPLHGRVTGQLVSGTSVTLEELEAMRGKCCAICACTLLTIAVDRVSQLLSELGEPTTGNASAKKQRLRFALGALQIGIQAHVSST